jgi:hypothetical protein
MNRQDERNKLLDAEDLGESIGRVPAVELVLEVGTDRGARKLEEML